jgi:general secretion pathway protein K
VTPRASTTAQGRSRGFALIVVLWFLVLIAAIGTYLMVSARTETAIARNIGLAAGAEALADAGIAQAAFNLTDTVETNRWKLDGAEHRLKLTTGEVRVRLFDENAKLNPNHASDVLLAALFESAGVERTRARRLGAAVADWVGADMMPRPLGAKLDQYRQAGLSYGPPNAPIESLDELQLVLGMTPEIFAAVRPYLTVYTDKDQPDAQNAPAMVQRALLLAARQMPADDAADTKGATGPSAPAAYDPDAPPPATDAAAPVGAKPASSDAKNPDAVVVSVEVIAQLAAGSVFVRHAVLRLDPANPKGYEVLDWRRGDLAAND